MNNGTKQNNTMEWCQQKTINYYFLPLSLSFLFLSVPFLILDSLFSLIQFFYCFVFLHFWKCGNKFIAFSLPFFLFFNLFEESLLTNLLLLEYSIGMGEDEALYTSVVLTHFNDFFFYIFMTELNNNGCGNYFRNILRQTNKCA